MFNECAVSVWNGGNVLELTGGDDSTTVRPNLIPLSVHLTQSGNFHMFTYTRKCYWVLRSQKHE